MHGTHAVGAEWIKNFLLSVYPILRKSLKCAWITIVFHEYTKFNIEWLISYDVIWNAYLVNFKIALIRGKKITILNAVLIRDQKCFNALFLFLNFKTDYSSIALLRDYKLECPDLDETYTWVTESPALLDNLLESAGRGDSPECPDFIKDSS